MRNLRLPAHRHGRQHQQRRQGAWRRGPSRGPVHRAPTTPAPGPGPSTRCAPDTGAVPAWGATARSHRRTGRRSRSPPTTTPPRAAHPPCDVELSLAEVAARVLVEGADVHHGATYELGGPQALSVRDLCDRASGPVSVKQVSVDEWMSRHGQSLSDDGRARLSAMFEFYDRHGFTAGNAVFESLLGRSPVRRRSGRPTSTPPRRRDAAGCRRRRASATPGCRRSRRPVRPGAARTP